MSANDEINLLLRNNTGNKSKQNLINGFVIRTKQFKTILADIKLSKANEPGQNFLIIGQRGAGKTTLLHRLKYAIEDDVDLAGIIPIMFSEEQYNLMDLVNLWESIGEHLESSEGFERLTGEMEAIDFHNSQREELVYELLDSELRRNQKKIIVFIENVDVFFKKIGRPGQKRLRDVLASSSYLRLICSSTTFFDGIIGNEDPFYEFFKVITLNGLTRTESVLLLNKLAEERNQTAQMEQILREHPKRLESLRRLTGGNPRVISYLFQIFQDNENGKAIVDLYKLLDDITFLYKSELDQLSAQQQKVIDAMARNWDAIATKEIVSKTRIESKQVSAILKTLEKNQLIETIGTKTKNNLYRIKDRFLNIWYLMRFGKRKEKDKVIWLVRFYDAWCDRSELSQRIKSLMKESDSGEYDPEAAMDMTSVYLSCKNVAPKDRFELHNKMQLLYPERYTESLPDKSLKEAVIHFVESKEFDKAIQALNQISEDSVDYYPLASWVYFRKGDDEISIDLLEKDFQRDSTPENARALGILFEEAFSEHHKALEYFEIALKNELWDAAISIGRIYLDSLDNYEQAEKYLLIAEKHCENKIGEVYTLLGQLYLSKDMKSVAEQYLLKGVGQNDSISAHLLGHYYDDNGDWEKSKEFFLKSYEWGKKSSLMCMFSCAFNRNQTEEIPFFLKKFEEIVKENPENYAAPITQARALLWDNQIEKAVDLISQIEENIFSLIEEDENEFLNEIAISELIRFFILLIAKGQYNAANEFFKKSNDETFKEAMKPIYFALMHYMKSDYPAEYLKAGDELKETIEEIIKEIEDSRIIYN